MFKAIGAVPLMSWTDLEMEEIDIRVESGFVQECDLLDGT